MMCLGLYGRVAEVDENGVIVDYDGVKAEVCDCLVDECAVGDYVLTHAGFILQKIDEQVSFGDLEIEASRKV